jgi:predicted nucleotidyltransferase
VRREEALSILTKHGAQIRAFGVVSLYLFGSVARDEASADSDVDLMVEFGVPVGLFEFVDFQMYLERLLGRRVDLITPEGLRQRLKEQVWRDAIRAA